VSTETLLTQTISRAFSSFCKAKFTILIRTQTHVGSVRLLAREPQVAPTHVLHCSAFQAIRKAPPEFRSAKLKGSPNKTVTAMIEAM